MQTSANYKVCAVHHVTGQQARQKSCHGDKNLQRACFPLHLPLKSHSCPLRALSRSLCASWSFVWHAKLYRPVCFVVSSAISILIPPIVSIPLLVTLFSLPLSVSVVLTSSRARRGREKQRKARNANFTSTATGNQKKKEKEKETE